jgi:hypothetical protein
VSLFGVERAERAAPLEVPVQAQIAVRAGELGHLQGPIAAWTGGEVVSHDIQSSDILYSTRIGPCQEENQRYLGSY